MAESRLQNLATEVAELRRAVADLTEAVRDLTRSAQPPVQVRVGQMEVERLAFFVPSIDVNEITGSLNIGITHLINPSDGDGQQDADGAAPIPADSVELWPHRDGKGEQP